VDLDESVLGEHTSAEGPNVPLIVDDEDVVHET
jgi:hypothetical protein